MTTKNLKIFHELNRLDTEERKIKRENAIKEKIKRYNEAKAKDDSRLSKVTINEFTLEDIAEAVAEILPEPEEPEPAYTETYENYEGEGPTIAEQLEVVKEVKEIINDKVAELDPGKVQCPECKGWFAKGGAFVNHYKSHFNNTE